MPEFKPSESMIYRSFLVSCCLLATSACGDDSRSVVDVPDTGGPDAVVEHGEEGLIYGFADECVAVKVADSTSASLELRADGGGFAFGADGGARFFMKASDLGTYLFYDEDRGYLVAEDGPLLRQTRLASDVYLVDDTYKSGAEWQLEFSERVSFRYQLKNRRTGRYLGLNGLVDTAEEAVAVELAPVEGCTPHPEMSLDARGTVTKTTWEDGDLFGFVDAHSHILSNFGFGGGGIMHGAPFHRLGVDVAMGSCELFHKEDGRADFLGAGFGDAGISETELLTMLNTGLLPEPSHPTDGWPTFSSWPGRTSATHQTQYYKWLERAWMAGLRVVVQHAVSNEVFCDLMAEPGFQPVRYSCRDMVNIDRQLEEIRNMERYIDAQWGGPGKGFFRVVESPAQAREVVAAGKMAVILGIEVPNLFDCYLMPKDGDPACDAAHIEKSLDDYYAKGVRVLFPNHKYDNAFTPGDGHRGIVELGNLVTTSHYSNFVEDCPDVNTVFDRGPVTFGGLNQPREAYLAPAAVEDIVFGTSPGRALVPYLGALREPALEGDWCQKAGMTEAGRTLMEGIMARGMIPEIDHLPRRSYLEAFEMLEARGYPAAGTHALNHDGKLYGLGGMSKTGFGRCGDLDNPSQMAADIAHRRGLLQGVGAYEAEGFGFDLNGMAGIPGPRFGEHSRCTTQQDQPVVYPFTSFDGSVTFEHPRMGTREVDFNTEGMIHIGLVAEYIEDARRTGVSDADLEFIFRSAEGYIRMWELADSKKAR